MALPSSSTTLTHGNHTVGSLVEQLWRSRWLVLVASMWIQACGGIGYAFGSYSPLIKSTLGYTQQQISLLGNAKDIGDAIGLISGSLIEILPTWCILLIGGLENLIGYGWLWLIVTQRAPVIPFWAVCILILVGTNGETYFNTAALVTNVRNFPKSRGHVVGLLKGFTGLCGAIFSQIYLTFLYPDQSAYLLLITLGPAIMSLLLMFIIRPIKAKTGDTSHSESIGFSFIYSDCLVLAAYLMAVLLIEDFISISFSLSLLITVVLLLLIILPLVTPVVLWYVRTNYPITTDATTITTPSTAEPPVAMPPVQDDEKLITTPLIGASEDQPLTSEVDFTSSDLGPELYRNGSRAGSFLGSVAFSEMEDEKPSEFDQLPDDIKQKKLSEIRNRFVHAVAEGAVRVKKKGPRRGEDFTLLQAFRKADFWLLFWALVCGSGTGLTAIDNMGQVSESQGYDNTSVFVSMLSIWNFLGRLLGGYTSEMLVRDYTLPRSWALAGALTMMAVGHFLIAMGWAGALYVGVLLVGVGYGSHWGIVPPIISEIFGMKNFGILYNFYIMASPAGSLFFSGFLAGYLYDIEAAKQQELGFMTSNVRLRESNTCVGAVCFRSTFLIMMGVCLFGIILSTTLSLRTMRVYKTLYGKPESTDSR